MKALVAQTICRIVLINSVRPDGYLTLKQLRWKYDAVIMFVKKIWSGTWMTKGAVELTAFVQVRASLSSRHPAKLSQYHAHQIFSDCSRTTLRTMDLALQ